MVSLVSRKLEQRTQGVMELLNVLDKVRDDEYLKRKFTALKDKTFEGPNLGVILCLTYAPVALLLLQ